MSETITNTVVTHSGPVRGKNADGVNIFLGIPYAKPPIGPLRFLAPQPCDSWTEPFDAFTFGNKAPNMPPPGLRSEKPDPNDPKNARFYAVEKVNTGNMVDEGPYDEDCLYLNIWTPALEDGGKRPVHVWVHGGGYSTGSGEADWFDGTNMAKRHDAVVVTLNHRLNVFGFLDLGAVAPNRFPDAGCAGMLDVVAVLRWVHDNIEAFGGSPEKVMIFGESGGGGKINTLLSMPAAKGLFKRAISMSGPTRFVSREITSKVTYSILKNLNICTNEIEKVLEVSSDELLNAARAVRVPGFGLTFEPVVDGVNLVCDPTAPESVEVNPDVEYMIGTTHDDARLWIANYEKDCKFDENELRTRLAALGFDKDKLTEAIETAKEGYEPEPEPANIYYSILTEIYFRSIAREVGDLRSSAGSTVYFYQFDRECPNPDCKAAHGTEVPFFFDNTDKAPYDVFGPDDKISSELANKIASMVTYFAATGDPNIPELPAWPKYNAEDRPIMVFGNGGICHIDNDHLPGIRKCLQFYRGSIGLP